MLTLSMPQRCHPSTIMQLPRPLHLLIELSVPDDVNISASTCHCCALLLLLLFSQRPYPGLRTWWHHWWEEFRPWRLLLLLQSASAFPSAPILLGNIMAWAQIALRRLCTPPWHFYPFPN